VNAGPNGLRSDSSQSVSVVFFGQQLIVQTGWLGREDSNQRSSQIFSGAVVSSSMQTGLVFCQLRRWGQPVDGDIAHFARTNQGVDLVVMTAVGERQEFATSFSSRELTMRQFNPNYSGHYSLSGVRIFWGRHVAPTVPVPTAAISAYDDANIC
jgi:hypothetical protein